MVLTVATTEGWPYPSVLVMSHIRKHGQLVMLLWEPEFGILTWNSDHKWWESYDDTPFRVGST